MSIRDRFCPKCGRPSENEGLCNRCRIDRTCWFTCDVRVVSTWCPSCGSTKQVNTWTDTGRERDALAPDLARAAVHFHSEVKKPYVEVRIQDISPNRSRAFVKVHGILFKNPVEGNCSIELVWRKEQCDRCNRISGNYYEGIVQVRADGRAPGSCEIQMASGIAQQIEESLQAGGERLSFISDMHETRDGLDIIIGSQHIGLLISQKIVSQLGGKYTTHPKLLGEKNEHPLYRVTYSVRLPRFQRRDIVVVNGRYVEVERVEAGHLRIFDLAEGVTRSIRSDDISRLVGNAWNAEPALVAYADSSIIGILDPVTCVTKESPQRKWRPVQNGQNIGILRDNERLVIMR